MKKIADVSAYLFVMFLVVLSAISILGVWDFFEEDVILKSFQSIGLLAVVAVIIMIADHFLDRRQSAADPDSVQSVAIFKGLRSFTIVILIISVASLALFGILSIWEVLEKEILHKSLASIAIVAFSSLVTIITCLEREKNPILHNSKISGGMVVLIIILSLIFVPILFELMW